MFCGSAHCRALGGRGFLHLQNPLCKLRTCTQDLSSWGINQENTNPAFRKVNASMPTWRKLRISSEVNLPPKIHIRAIYGANSVTHRSDTRASEASKLHRVVSSEKGTNMPIRISDLVPAFRPVSCKNCCGDGEREVLHLTLLLEGGKVSLLIRKHDHYHTTRNIKRHVRALANNHPEGSIKQVSPLFRSLRF